MQHFLESHADRVSGVLSGFDRVLFRGTNRTLSYVEGMEMFLACRGVLYKDFSAFVQKLSKRIKDHAENTAKRLSRPFHYLESTSVSKLSLAREIMERDRIVEGLICVFSCVESCRTYAIKKDRQKKKLRLISAERKCLHLYFYYVDRQFGLMHVRLQTWLPFTMHVCINGREYLARRMDKAGISYERRENCFTRIDNLPKAQAILDGLTTRRWCGFLDALAKRVNPWLDRRAGLDLRSYYWTVRQGEYATDVMFKDDQALAEIYPSLVNHAIEQFSSRDVLRFLGRRITPRFTGEITSDIVHRHEGIRVKHRVQENSIKMYDKQGSVLRIETTINNPHRFHVRRMVTRKGQRQIGWNAMRKGVVDIPRRVEISRAANERYLDALATVNIPGRVREILDPISRRVVRDGRPYRALRPVTKDEANLFRAVLDGKHFIQGFRNVDIRRNVAPGNERDPYERRRAAARVTRLLRLLRAHRLIRKVPSRTYYRVTQKGHRVMSTALKLREGEVAALAA